MWQFNGFIHPVPYCNQILIILLAMHRLFKLLNGPFKHTQENPTIRFPFIDDIYPRRRPANISAAETLDPIRLNLSLHKPQKQKQKSGLRVNGISQSQRFQPNLDNKNNAIRISKNIFKVNDPPPQDSHIAISIDASISDNKQMQILQKSCSKHIKLVLNPEQESKRSLISHRKNPQAGRRQQKGERNSKKSVKNKSNKKLKEKKCKLLSLIGTECHINQHTPTIPKKTVRLSPFRTLDV